MSTLFFKFVFTTYDGLIDLIIGGLVNLNCSNHLNYIKKEHNVFNYFIFSLTNVNTDFVFLFKNEPPYPAGKMINDLNDTN